MKGDGHVPLAARLVWLQVWLATRLVWLQVWLLHGYYSNQWILKKNTANLN